MAAQQATKEISSWPERTINHTCTLLKGTDGTSSLSLGPAAPSLSGPIHPELARLDLDQILQPKTTPLAIEPAATPIPPRGADVDCDVEDLMAT